MGLGKGTKNNNGGREKEEELKLKSRRFAAAQMEGRRMRPRKGGNCKSISRKLNYTASERVNLHGREGFNGGIRRRRIKAVVRRRQKHAYERMDGGKEKSKN